MAVHQRQLRSDAQRSITAIVDAAVDVFAKDAAASMTHIANAAGVGRVTLYAHFPSREAVLDAVVDRVMAEAAEIHAQLDLDDAQTPADQMLSQWLKASWWAVDRYGRIRVAAEAALGWERLRARHDPVFQHLEALLVRGRTDGTFRDDLPLEWLASTVYVLVHGAADQVEAGRLSREHVTDYLVATVLGALRPATS